jgi:site-specific DNA-methyltransferase (adenine-specific)
MISLINADCLEAMRDIPNGSVDMVLTDPPYGTVKGAGLDGWEGVKTDWDTVIDQGQMLDHCNRILRTNGCLALFCQDPYTSQLITKAHGNLPFSYRYTWLKDHFANALIAKKAPVNYTEDVCVFFKKHTKHDFEGFHPLRDYSRKVLDFAGCSLKVINEKLGHRRAEHFFYTDSTQFSICTEETYAELCGLYDLESQPWFIEYSILKEDDAKYRKALIEQMTEASPKVFNLLDGAKFKSNVLTYKKDYTGLHPTQKPLALMQDLIRTYTNAGDTVLDFTMGSGTTGAAAKILGRSFIGIELDPDYFALASKRIADTPECGS